MLLKLYILIFPFNESYYNHYTKRNNSSQNSFSTGSLPLQNDFIVYNYICIFKTGQNQKILLTKLSFLELHNPRSLPKKLHQ